MADRYWKVLDANGRSCHGGSFRWSLPTWDARKGWVPGEWTPPITNLEPCARGYHVCRDEDLLVWLGPRIYACEVRGTIIEAENKVAVTSVRLTCPTPWDETAARLFAVECAADALPIFERRSPNDSRVADALEVAFRYAVGDATDAELAAARAGAIDAARAAVGDAAGDAAWASAWPAAGDAARDAAWAAAGDAAGDAAIDAAWVAARAAQTKRLLVWLNAASTAETTGATE